jgi:hypothetical protein
VVPAGAAVAAVGTKTPVAAMTAAPARRRPNRPPELRILILRFSFDTRRNHDTLRRLTVTQLTRNSRV